MERRDFLKAGAMAAAGAAVFGCGRGKGENTAPGPLPADSSKVAIPDVEPEPVKGPVAYIPDGHHGLKLSWEPYELQLAHTFTVSGNSRTTTPDVQVKLEFDGFTGYGEASMPPYLGYTVKGVCADLAKLNLHKFRDPFKIDDILSYTTSTGACSPALAAVDIALHDLVGKLLGQPLWRIWGLDPSKCPATTFTIGIDTPDVVREKTLEAADRFKILKVKVGVGEEQDKAMIEAIRSVTNLPLAVDANQGWTDKFAAMSEIFWLKEHGVVMVEQPMPKACIDEIAWLRERCGVPIFADEAVQGTEDINQLAGVYDGINIKLMKCGGLAEARKMMAIARGLGMKVMLGCMTETSCAVTAAAQISPGVDFADLDGNLLISNDRFIGAVVKDGKITLPDGPGLGLTVLG